MFAGEAINLHFKSLTKLHLNGLTEMERLNLRRGTEQNKAARKTEQNTTQGRWQAVGVEQGKDER